MNLKTEAGEVLRMGLAGAAILNEVGCNGAFECGWYLMLWRIGKYKQLCFKAKNMISYDHLIMLHK